mgnify:FL=1
MAINLEKKSNRLLGNRRFTSADLNTSQESFTDVLDIGAGEILSQASSIPSSALPFSGSTQSGQIHQVGGFDIMKYYFRQRLTRSNVANDVFFFMTPTGSTSGVTPQLIQSGQQTNFISPKYSISALANANTEDGTPGYGVKVFKSTSTNSGSLGGSDIVSTNDYQFDYKTGVLQFDSALNSNDEVYMSAYQYVGTTLETRLDMGSGTGSFGRIEATHISASQVDVDASTIRVGGEEINQTLVGNIKNTFSSTESQDSTTVTGSFGRVEATTVAATEYIVTSSVTHKEIIAQSGSTQFGDDIGDTHEFTGSLSLSGSFLPTKDDLIDLGSTLFQWKDLHLDGTANIDTLSLTDAFTYNNVTFNTRGGSSDNLHITGSAFSLKATDSSDLFTLYNSSDEISVQFDDKVLVLGSLNTAPTPVAGGLFYSGSDEWFLGYEN